MALGQQAWDVFWIAHHSRPIIEILQPISVTAVESGCRLLALDEEECEFVLSLVIDLDREYMIVVNKRLEADRKKAEQRNKSQKRR